MAPNFSEPFCIFDVFVDFVVVLTVVVGIVVAVVVAAAVAVAVAVAVPPLLCLLRYFAPMMQYYSMTTLTMKLKQHCCLDYYCYCDYFYETNYWVFVVVL